MFHNTPKGAKICLVTDVRTEANANADIRKPKGEGEHSVHDFWKPGMLAFGKANWQRDVARVSLFEFGQRVTSADRKQAKSDLLAYLSEHKFRDIIVVGNRSKSAQKVYNDDYAEASHSDTVSWGALKPPANLREMHGTFWDTKYGRVLALQNPQNIDYVYGAVLHRWLTAVANELPTFLPPAKTTHTEPGDGMRAGLNALLAAYYFEYMVGRFRYVPFTGRCCRNF